MKISEIKKALSAISAVSFRLPDGNLVPAHFHVTELGLINKKFIDCGGIIRHEKSAQIQLWVADDVDHRLDPKKFLKIMDHSEEIMGNEDPEVEVEYQGETIGKYGLEFSGSSFVLVNKQTNCLAPDKCGVPSNKTKVSLAELRPAANCCQPGDNCC